MILTALSALGSLGGAIIGASQSARANNQALDIARQGYRDTDNILQSQLRSPYTSRTDYQQILNKQKDILDEQWKRVQGAQAVAGSSGSLEAGAAQKQANALSLADTMGNLAAGASSYKDDVQARAIANQQQQTATEVASKQAQARNIAQAGGQVTQAMAGIAQADSPAYDDAVFKMFGLTKPVR